MALARAKFALDDVDEAIAAVELNPNLGWAHCLLGMLCLQINSLDDAVIVLEKATQTSPQDSLLVIILGGHALASVLLDQFDKAVELYR